MTGKNWKYLEITGHCWQWLELLEIAGNGGNGWKWLDMAGHGWKCLKITGNEERLQYLMVLLLSHGDFEKCKFFL